MSCNARTPQTFRLHRNVRNRQKRCVLTLGFSLISCPSCACVSFFSSLADCILFFSSVGTLHKQKNRLVDLSAFTAPYTGFLTVHWH